MMTYTKPMIDLVQELRKRLNQELGVKVRISDPDLLTHMCEYYRRSANEATQSLIKELLGMAGKAWLDIVSGPAKSPTGKMYRGQPVLTDKPPVSKGGGNSTAKPRMYRGQIVDS